MKRLLLSLMLLAGLVSAQDELVSPHLKGPPFFEKTITTLGSTLDPGSYTLTPGQYNFAVTGATPSPSPTPSPTPNPTPSPTPAPTPSPDGTAIPPATQIIDAALNIWTLVNGVVLSNGDPAGHSANVIQVLWKGGKIWQENDQHGWWYWNGSAWIAGAAPVPTPTPSPTPSPAPGKPGLSYFGGIQGWGFASKWVPPDSQWHDLSGATGSQFPSNWWRDDYTMGYLGWHNYNHGPDTDSNSLRSHWKIARQWCDAHHANGPCVQLKYPGHDGSCPTKEAYIEFLQAIAPYCPAGTLQICINEVLRSNNQQGGDDLLGILGGPGATGYDGLIALVKLQRQYLPGVLLGLNEFNVCDLSSGNSFYYNSQCISAYKALAEHGAKLDWLGCEGYWLNHVGGPGGTPEPLTGGSGNFASYKNCIDYTGAAILPYLTGAMGKAFIAFTEFTPGGWYCDQAGHPVLAKNQKDLWKLILEMFANDQYVFGVTGPWEAFRYSGKFGSDWFWNDLNNGAVSGDCTNAAITPTLTWLQSWVPANVHN